MGGRVSGLSQYSCKNSSDSSKRNFLLAFSRFCGTGGVGPPEAAPIWFARKVSTGWLHIFFADTGWTSFKRISSRGGDGPVKSLLLYAAVCAAALIPDRAAHD